MDIVISYLQINFCNLIGRRRNLNIYNNTITIDSRVRASKAVLPADIEASKNWFKYHLRERQREAFKM